MAAAITLWSTPATQWVLYHANLKHYPCIMYTSIDNLRLTCVA